MPLKIVIFVHIEMNRVSQNVDQDTKYQNIKKYIQNIIGFVYVTLRHLVLKFSNSSQLQFQTPQNFFKQLVNWKHENTRIESHPRKKGTQEEDSFNEK